MKGSSLKEKKTSKKKQGKGEHHDFQNDSHRWNDFSCDLCIQFRTAKSKSRSLNPEGDSE